MNTSIDVPVKIDTNIEWFSAQATHPGSSGYYLTYSVKSGGFQSLEYSAKHNAWNVSDKEDEPAYPVKITYWAHMPKELTILTEEYYG